MFTCFDIAKKLLHVVPENASHPMRRNGHAGCAWGPQHLFSKVQKGLKPEKILQQCHPQITEHTGSTGDSYTIELYRYRFLPIIPIPRIANT